MRGHAAEHVLHIMSYGRLLGSGCIDADGGMLWVVLTVAVGGCRVLVHILVVVCFFFFSSRRRHTRFDCDWSSDVCSSDLAQAEAADEIGVVVLDDDGAFRQVRPAADAVEAEVEDGDLDLLNPGDAGVFRRSEERRVGKECRSRWSPYH